MLLLTSYLLAVPGKQILHALSTVANDRVALRGLNLARHHRHQQRLWRDNTSVCGDAAAAMHGSEALHGCCFVA